MTRHRPFYGAFLVFASLIVAAPPPVAAQGAASGSYGFGGAAFEVVDGVAYETLDWEGTKVVVLLSSVPLDPAQFRGKLDLDGAAEEWKDDSSWIELSFGHDGAWKGTSYALRYDGGMSSGSSFDGSAGDGMKATISGDQVSGTLAADFGEGEVVALTLAVPILRPAGEPIAAGGGDLAEAARACVAAFAAQEISGVKRSCATDVAEIIESALRMRKEGYEMDDPWTQAGASECELAASKAPELGAGLIHGDEARVEVTADWNEEKRCVGPVFLRRDGGRWRVTASRMNSIYK